MMEPIDDTILFPGSPWPKGHAIKEFDWYLQLEAPGQIRCHLHLKSANYDENEHSENCSERKGRGNWQSTTVWNNYGSCVLSSIYWDHSGFLIATTEDPLDIATLSGRTFEIDPLPFDFDDEPSFGIYCQGHDNVAGHKILLTKSADGWTFDWRAKIALTFLGSIEFENDLVARKKAVKFPNITVPPDLDPSKAEAMLAECIGPSTEFEQVQGQDGVEFKIIDC